MTNHTSITQSLSRPHLLELAPQLRHQIYLHLPLVDELHNPRVLNLAGKCRVFSGDCIEFHGLLLSCWTLYSEVSAMLYSRNHFVIRYSRKGSLQPLRNLSDTSLAHLTSLKIVLNEFSCHSEAQTPFGPCCLDGESDYGSDTCDNHEHHNDKVTKKLISSTNRMLQEWKYTAKHLSSRIQSTNLDLSVVCDVFNEKETTIANRAVAPIFLLAPLKDCHIRLGERPNPQLQHVAQGAALRARGILRAAESKPNPTVPFSESKRSVSRLLALPAELRLHILQYTDLITPWREVTWSGQRRRYKASLVKCSKIDSFDPEWPRDCFPNIHHGCQFRRCHHTFPEVSMGCFCRVRHAAFSSRCKCWTPPTSLFLICSTLYADAQVVFFSGNRFVVHDLNAKAPWKVPRRGNYPRKTFAASQFLRKVVPSHCLSQLRFLEFVFPPYDSTAWPQDGHPALREWADTIEWLRTQVHASALTVRLVMAGPGDTAMSDERRHMTETARSAIFDAYNRIMMPLASLESDHLRGFYAQFSWPEGQNKPGNTFWETGERDWRKREELNERAERMIMGKRCDEMVRRHDRPPSVWMHSFDRIYTGMNSIDPWHRYYH